MSSETIISASDIRKHSGKGNLWLSIHNSVYDVSEFMDDHPGGADALLDLSGIDATNAFEDVGHSSDARALMGKFRIGKAAKLPSDSRMSSGDFMKLEQQDSNWYPSSVGAFLLLLCIVTFFVVR